MLSNAQRVCICVNTSVYVVCVYGMHVHVYVSTTCMAYMRSFREKGRSAYIINLPVCAIEM